MAVSPARAAIPARITYIDGLRGVAILLVLVHHAWLHTLARGAHTAHTWVGGGIHLTSAATPLDQLLSRGYQGVSLFLVVSGFCLAFPLWKRREAGDSDWFKPSEFFARRCLRILPPYYVALGLFIVISAVLTAQHVQELASLHRPNDVRDWLSQVLLLRNLGPGPWVNGSFWSLGLEWQWYWAFPLVLLLCARSPVVALPVCLAVATSWYVEMHGVFLVNALPVRIFEFCCGVATARLVVGRWSPPRLLLALGTIVPLLIAELSDARLLHPVAQIGLFQPLHGIAFASLLLLGWRSGIANAALSWRPLVRLGIVSYSVYLIHEPVVETVEVFAPPALRLSLLVMPVAIAAGVALGVVFHLTIERPCMSSATWIRLGPTLTHLCRWVDPLYGCLGITKPARTGANREGSVASAAEKPVG